MLTILRRQTLNQILPLGCSFIEALIKTLLHLRNVLVSRGNLLLQFVYLVLELAVLFFFAK